MGKIYCITGQSKELRENVFEALLDWSEKSGSISFSMPDPDGTYNLYLNDYLTNVDWEEYKQLTEQFDEEMLIPVYLGIDEEYPELRDFGVIRTYNVSYDDHGFDQGVKEILSSEFAYYKNDYNFREKEEVIEEVTVEEGNPDGEQFESDKKKTFIKYRDKLIRIGKAVIVFLKKRKKIELAGMAAVLCIIMAAVIVLSVISGRPDPFYSKNNIDIFTGYGDSTYVFNSNGDMYTFDGYSSCSINKTIDSKNAILTTNYNELYYLTEGDARKITDDVYCSYISNKGDYIYYITKIEDYYFLYKYETESGETEKLDEFPMPDENGYCEMTASPDGKILALNFNSGSFTEQCVYDFSGEKTSLGDGVGSIYAVTDKGDVYLNDLYGKFVVARRNGNEYTYSVITNASVGYIYFNSDLSEVMYCIYNENIQYFIFTEDKGNISISVSDLLKSIYSNLYNNMRGFENNNIWRIKETVSSINYNGIISMIYDIDTFRDLYYHTSDGSICRLNADYSIKKIYSVNEAYGNGFLSDNGKFILYSSSNDSLNRIYTINENGNKSVLLEYNHGQDSFDIIGITNNKSIYYYNRNDNYLYYKKGFSARKIAYIQNDINIDGDYYYNMYDNNIISIDNDKDIVYYIADNKLYYSVKGGKPVEIKTENNIAETKIIKVLSTGVYYAEETAMYNENQIFITTKVYKLTDSYELDFLFEYETKQIYYE